jgi:hypothetical protein
VWSLGKGNLGTPKKRKIFMPTLDLLFIFMCLIILFHITYLTKFIIKKISEIAIVKLTVEYNSLFFPLSLRINLNPKIAIVTQTPSCIGKYELKT